MTRRAQTTAVLAVIAGAIGISFAAIFAKKAMQQDVGPMASAFWRLVLAIPIFTALAWPTLRRGKLMQRYWTPFLLLPPLFFGLDLLTWHLAFTFTTAGVSTLLANVSVVFVGIGGWLLLREKLDWRWAAGAFLAMSGVGALAIMTQASTSAPDPLRGNVLSLGTALCYAGYLLSAKVLRRATPTSIIMLSVVTGAPLVLLVGMLVTGEQFLPKTADAWLWLILLAIVPQSLGQGLVIWGLRSLPASFGAVVLLIQPVATTVWGSLMLGELLSAWDIGFGMLVLGGIVLARFGTHEPQATTLQPCNTPNSNCKV